MADQKISQLTELTNPNPNDVIPIVNGGSTKKITVANLAVAGSSGTSGSNGSSGTSGNNGSSGTSGLNGSNGSSGTSGSNGSSGTSGVNGTSGTSGTSGSSGSNGSSGTSGSNGSSGTSGGTGSSGTSGSSGISVSASYMRGSRSTQQTSGITANGIVIFTQTDTSTGSDISLNTSTGKITLAADKTYRLMAQIPGFVGTSGKISLCWYNENTSTWIGSQSQNFAPSNAAAYGGTGGLTEAIITTTGSTVVSYRIVDTSGVSGLGGNTDFTTTNSYPWFDVEVISGYSAVVNGTSGTSGSSGISPSLVGYAITGSNVFNGNQTITGSLTTTDNVNIGVGIGDEGGELHLALAATNNNLTGSVNLDVWRNRLRLWEGGGNARGVYVDLSKAPDGVGGELLWKASAFVNSGVALTLGDIQVQFSTSGNRSLQIKTTGSNFSATVAGYTAFSSSGNQFQYLAGQSISVTGTMTYLLSTWNFIGDGDIAVYNVRDTTNLRFWRITLMVGPTYSNNMITIERLV